MGQLYAPFSTTKFCQKTLLMLYIKYFRGRTLYSLNPFLEIRPCQVLNLRWTALWYWGGSCSVLKRMQN